MYYLKYLANKTLKQRRRSGLDDYRSVPILNNQIVDIIKKQIKETEKLRLIGKTRYIFVKFAKGGHRLTNQQTINRHLGTTVSMIINNCIKRNEVKGNQGNLWHYSNHQCRKTLAVNLLSEGSSISEVGEILGHMEEKTTRQYYQDVDAMKIAKLDQQLFDQLFETINNETRNAYTPLELEQLKIEIMTGSRETPEGHGSCLKHVSFGPCKKRSCVGCSLLLTGPQKLPMWRKLHTEQQTYVDNMIKLMEKQGVKDYGNYRDFQAESHLLAVYEDTIAKIENFIEKRIPLYGKEYTTAKS